MITDVIVKTEKKGLVTTASEIDFHTDHHKAKYVVWYCHKQTDLGGESLLIDIEKIFLTLTKNKQQNRWFQNFIYMLTAFFSSKKLITSLFILLKRTVPVYERVPVYKRDNRYSSGKRIVRWNSVVKEHRKFADEELELNKKQQFSRTIFNGITLTISIGLFFICIFQKTKKLNVKEKNIRFHKSKFVIPKVYLCFNNFKCTFFNPCVL